MKKLKRSACAIGLLLTIPLNAGAWIQFLDGSSVPTAPWVVFDDPLGSDSTAVVDFLDPATSLTNQALRISTATDQADEWYLTRFGELEVAGGTRFRLVDFGVTGKDNILDITTRSTLLSPAPAVTLVDGRFKLWNYVEADTEIMDIGPADTNVFHTVYLWARNDGRVKLWWDGRLIFDDITPLVNPYDGYLECGIGSWEYSGSATMDFDWIGSGDSSDLPIFLSTVPAHLSSYNTNSTFSFTVIDTNGVASNAFTVSLNGVDRTTELVVSGSNTNRQGSLAGLLPNRFYHVALTLTDLATNTSSYTIDFDTIDQNNFTFEAEDWNFDGGQFLDTVVLSSTPGPSNYLDRVGVEEVDENELSTDPTASQHHYRLTSLVGTERTADSLRQKFIDAQVNDPVVEDYHVGGVEVGEWLNYTRTFPAGEHLVYGRLASGNAGAFEASLAKVTGAATSNQTATALGSFKGSTGHGWQYFDWIPLTDNQGNLVVANLSGVETLRVTATQGSWNANFFMLVPAPPKLAIALANGQALVSWPTNPPNFNLQGTTNLSQANWLNIPGPFALVNGRYTVTNSLSGAARYFRLWR